ncbi:hypothetical protein O181_049970 [Austropuccinia psidii MF-1]|uniref:Uncharacterized protein n=1 Tax=Austropuccinia psidii MF-1 TaxID=1389203 RepID=A0A9Q3DUI1_9BASI|nr:hypothetical protein [Austropuccinia psidii MF-1]
MLAYKHTRNPCLLSGPSDHTARGVPYQDALTRTALWSTMMKAFPSGNGRQDPKQDNRKDSGQLAQSHQVLICPSPLLGHHLLVTSLLNRREVIIQPMKDGNGKRIFELEPIVTMSCHPWDSNSKPNQPNPPQQHSPIPSLPGEQTPPQPTSGLSGTQWLEDLFHGKQPKLHLISTFDSSELTVPPIVEPSQMDEPPIPGRSPSSKPHEDVLTSRPGPPHYIFIIDDRLVRSPLPDSTTFPLCSPKNLTASSPHSHNDAVGTPFVVG